MGQLDSFSKNVGGSLSFERSHQLKVQQVIHTKTKDVEKGNPIHQRIEDYKRRVVLEKPKTTRNRRSWKETDSWDHPSEMTPKIVDDLRFSLEWNFVKVKTR